MNLLVLNMAALPLAGFFVVVRMGWFERFDRLVVRASMIDLIVENQTARPIHVTPIGDNDDGSRRVPLPLYTDATAAERMEQRGRFKLDPGGRLRLYYPWHDVRHSHLVVEDESGGRYVTAGSPQQVVRTPDRTADFVIADLTVLGAPPADVMTAYSHANAPRRSLPVWPGVVPFVTFLGLAVGYWQMNRRWRGSARLKD
jgi:hypothetical protein